MKPSKGKLPLKLYRMLELADAEGFGSYSDSVAWLPHGRAFKVVHKDRFMRYIAPNFFKQTKIRSFDRQLNLWGFKR